MNQRIQAKENLRTKLKFTSKIFSVLIILIAITVLTGWIFNITILKSTLPGLVTMKTNTAIGFLLSGISLYLWTIKNKSQKIRRIAQICAFLVLLIGLSTIIEYTFNLNLGIDQLIFKETLAVSDISIPNRMSPVSSVLFIILGYALIFLNNKEHIKFTQLAAIIGGFTGLFGFIGYVYNVGPVYGIGNYTPMALISTLTFLILSLGILFKHADRELMKIVTSPHFGGYVADSLLPPAVVVPLLLGSLTLLGWKLSIYGAEFSISIVVLSNIAIFTVVIWWSANSFNKMDIKRKNAENQLKEYQNHLEKKVEERTEELRYANKQLQSEIAERKLMEGKIKLSLEEKELLLKELHHRVKNNMQIISSLLSLQSNYLEDKNAIEKSKLTKPLVSCSKNSKNFCEIFRGAENLRFSSELEVFKESQNRVKSMALVHEKLYRSKDFKSIDFGDYINSLVSNLAGSYVAQFIDFNVDVKSISLDINNAIPCGLIINEIITNSFKHAFPADYIRGPENEKFSSPNNRTGKIDIDFYKDDEEYTLIISDNGIGFPKDLDFKNAPTLGLQLINMLVKQLNGTIELDKTHGTTFKISFKELTYKKRI